MCRVIPPLIVWLEINCWALLRLLTLPSKNLYFVTMQTPKITFKKYVYSNLHVLYRLQSYTSLQNLRNLKFVVLTPCIPTQRFITRKSTGIFIKHGVPCGTSTALLPSSIDLQSCIFITIIIVIIFFIYVKNLLKYRLSRCVY